MKVVLLHGDDKERIDGRVVQIINGVKKRSWDIVRHTKEDKFKDLVSSVGLFEIEKIVLVQGIDSIKSSEWKWFLKNHNNLRGNLLVYQYKEVPKSKINYLPKETKIETFKTQKLLWTFLDSTYPGNSDQSIKLFNKLVKTESVELVFALLSSLMRDLFIVLNAPSVANFPAWKLGKLKNQANKFGVDNLNIFIRKLADIDMKVKTSNASLKDELDLLIIKTLK